MRISRRVWAAVMITFCGYVSVAQDEKFGQKEENQHELTAEKKEKLADKLMMEGSYYSAVDYYTEIWNTDTSRYDLKYKIALSYFFSRDYAHAEPWFAKAVTLDPKAPTLAFYYYGESLRHNQKYELAKEQFEAFKKVKYGGIDGKDKKRFATEHAKACDYALAHMSHPVHGRIENLGDKVNSNYTDFSPWRTSDSTLIYASLRSDTVLHAHAGTTEFYPVHLFETKTNGEEWGEPTELGPIFNKHFAHSANPVFSKDGNTIYFTECKPIHDQVKCHIYSSVKENGEWQKPHRLHDHINGSKYTSTQPGIGYYEKKVKKEVKEVPVLYFVSDRTGTKGGMDIWYSEFDDNGHFKRPKNCGTKINTPGDDISPYYSPKEGVLYFSSNFHLGYGGLDGFKSKGQLKTWEEPVNLGYGLNSSLDDTYFTADSTGKEGFLVSNRPGGHALTSETCCDDIYSYTLVPEKPMSLDGIAFDTSDVTHQALTNTTVSLYMKKANGEDSLINTITTSDDALTYQFVVLPDREYFFDGNKEGYESERFSFTTTHMDETDTIHIDYPMWPAHPVPPKDTTVVVAKEPQPEPEEKEPEPMQPGFVLKNVLHDFDVAAHTAGTGINLDDVIKVMKDNPYLIISIESHTDNKGSDEYNLKLSERRAAGAKTYLLRSGISGSRIKVKFYGESMPVAPNEHPDGSDNPEGRAQNRRTEFKVVSNTKF